MYRKLNYGNPPEIPNKQQTRQGALMSRKGMWYTGVSWTERQLENAVVSDRCGLPLRDIYRPQSALTYKEFGHKYQTVTS